MNLSTPGEMEDSGAELGNIPAEQGERTGKEGKFPVEQGERLGKLSDSTVTLFGGEMDLWEGVELMGDMLERPGEFGFVEESEVEELEERIGELVEEKEQLRRDLAVVWSALAKEGPDGERVVPLNGGGVPPLTLELHEPTAEFVDGEKDE